MSDIEVVELAAPAAALLVYDTPDPLDGAQVVSVADTTVPSGGGSGAGQSYSHTQVTPSTVWLILHPLPFTPSGIRVTGPDGGRLYPKRESYPASGRVRLDFTAPVSGTAYLS